MEEKTINIKQYLSFLVPLLLAMLIIVSFSIVISKRHTEWKQVLSKKNTLEKGVAQLQEKNLGLHKLRDNLLYDPVQIEKEVREQLGYGRPEEVIYKVANSNVSDSTIKEEPPNLSVTQGRFEKIGLFSFFVIIIMITAGFFGFTYWYEYRRIRQ